MKGKSFKIKSADRRHFVTRMHWALVFVTNDEIDTVISQYAEVRSIKHELYVDAGLEGVATGVRIMVLVGDRHQVPYIIQIVDPDTREVWDCLVTIPGRPQCVCCARKLDTCARTATRPSAATMVNMSHDRGVQHRESEENQTFVCYCSCCFECSIDRQTVTDEDNETDDIDRTAATGLRNDGVHQTASAEPREPLKRDAHAHPVQNLLLKSV